MMKIKKNHESSLFIAIEIIQSIFIAALLKYKPIEDIV
jgi:hypothetical protein